MSDLTLEQCKNLAEWGLPQEIRNGSWIYFLSDGKLVCCDLVTVPYLEMKNAKPSVDYVCIPTPDKLMEFAKTLSLTWLVKPSPDGWRVTKAAEGICKLSSWTDPSLWQVVYKLIERHFEKDKDETQS